MHHYTSEVGYRGILVSMSILPSVKADNPKDARYGDGQKDGKLGYASRLASNYGTKLGLIPVPSLSEIKSQGELETKEISKEAFEQMWREANAGQ